MAILLSLLFGAFIGWVGSLLMRTDTNEKILFDIAVGGIAAFALAILLAGNSTFDDLVAAYLGAVSALGLLYFIREKQKDAKLD